MFFFLAGQSCGYFYGDCRGLPTYAIISIISGCILLLSICIRCCAYAAGGNTQPIRRVPIVRRRAQNPAATYQGNASTVVPIHSIQEDAPPTYEAAAGYQKY
jgi:hypothetical protein